MRKLGAVFIVFAFCWVSLCASADDINVYAAASLTDVMNELANNYQQQHTTVKIKPSYASSSTLAKQIENGAPADLFISADGDWADYVDKRALFLAGSRKNLLGNELVLIAPLGKEFSITLDNKFDFAASFSGRLCTGESNYVPVGKYAQQALMYYGWWEPIKARVVGTDDVRTATAFIERGECPVGIVYSTDAKISKKVSVIASFPALSHKPIIYPGALLKRASVDSKEFWAYLQTAEAKAVFVRYGFTVL
jgi:molybdate transport system substrate-binding protein